MRYLASSVPKLACRTSGEFTCVGHVTSPVPFYRHSSFCASALYGISPSIGILYVQVRESVLHSATWLMIRFCKVHSQGRGLRLEKWVLVECVSEFLTLC